jgi:tetratricopeptide (TPR) repeat protein
MSWHGLRAQPGTTLTVASDQTSSVALGVREAVETTSPDAGRPAVDSTGLRVNATLPKPSLDETSLTLRLGSKWRSLLDTVGISQDDLYLYVGAPFQTPEERRSIAAKRHFFFGQYYMELEEPAHALGEFRAALEEDPGNVHIKLGLVDALLASRDYNGAEKALNEVLSADSQNVPALILLAQINMSRAEDAAGQNRRLWLDKGIAAFERAKAIQPKNLDVLKGLASAYVAQQNVAKLIQAYREILAANPKDTYSMLVLANVLAKTGNQDEAVTFFEKVIEQRRGFVNAYIYLGQLYEEMNRNPDAIDIYKRALLIEPRNVQLQRRFEAVLEKANTSGGRTAVLREYGKFASEFPFSTEIQRLYAEQLKESGDVSGAIQQYKKVAHLDPENLDALVALGGLYAQRGDFDTSGQYYTKALDINPERADLYEAIGATFANLKDRRKALEIFQKALKLNPKVPMLYVNLASLYQQEGRVDDAVRVLEDAVVKIGDKPEFFVALGEILERDKKLDRSVECFRKAYELVPQNHILLGRILMLLAREQKFDEAEALVVRAGESFKDHKSEFYALVGEAYLAEAEIARAADYYRRALDEAPEKFGIYARLVQVYNTLGRHDESLAVLTRAQEKFPGSDDVKRLFAETYLSRKEYDPAIAIYRGFVESRPESLDSYRLLVDALNKAGRHEEALGVVKKAEDKIGRSEEVTAIRGVTFFQQKRYDAAERIFRELSLGKGKNIDTYLYMLGSIYLEQKRSDSAERVLKKAIEKNPLNDSALNALGYMYADQGRNLEEAKKLIEKALELNPSGGHIIDSLGWAYFKMGKIEKARELVEKAARIMGEDSEILEHLGDIYLAQGDPIRAVEHWKKSLELDGTQDDVREKIVAHEKK